MIVRQETGSNFSRLGKYLEHGDKHRGNYVEDPSKRVAWSETRNLVFPDRRRVVQAMTLFASINDRVEKPVLHLIVSWQSGNEERGVPPDNPTREEMVESADRVLGALDLEEHQAWMVAHKDTDTPHLHIMVNKVHTFNSRCWNSSFSQVRLWDVSRQLEKEFGWDPAGPDRLETIWEQKTVPETYWEKNYEELGRKAPFSVIVRTICTERFEAAGSWPDLEKRLAEVGARLEPRRRRGMVIESGGRHLALSKIRRDFSRPKLERRFGMAWTAYQELKERGLSQEEIERWAGSQEPDAASDEVARAAPRPESDAPRPGREKEKTAPQEPLPDKAAAPEEPAAEVGEAQVAEALAFAQDFYAGCYADLPEEHPAKRYVRDIFLCGEEAEGAVKAAGIGYAPEGGKALCEAQAGKGFSPQAVKKAGLAAVREEGGESADRLCGCLTVPMTGPEGEIVGLGRLSLEERGPEETPPDGLPAHGAKTRSPSRGLFGAQRAAQREGPLYVTQESACALQLQQAGFRAVALGARGASAAQAAQIRALCREDESPVLLFESSPNRWREAEAAALRLIEAGAAPRILRLPEGHDAGSYLQHRGRDAMASYAAGATEQWAHFVVSHQLYVEDGDRLSNHAEALQRTLDYAACAPTEKARERLFVEAAEAYLGGRPSTGAVEAGSLGGYCFDRFRQAFERRLEEQGIAVRSWEKVQSVYPDLFDRAEEQRGHKLGEAVPLQKIGERTRSHDEERAPTPLTALKRSVRQGGRLPAARADVHREWKMLGQVYRASTRRQERLRDAWNKALRASFAEPEKAQEAFRNNALAHSRERARWALLHPKEHSGAAFASAGPTHQRRSARATWREMHGLHEKLSGQEAVANAAEEYAAELSRVYFALGEPDLQRAKGTEGEGTVDPATPPGAEGLSNRSRWGDLRARVEAEVERRVRVCRADAIVERVERAARVRRARSLEAKLTSISRQPNIEAYRSQAEEARRAFASKLGRIYADPDGAVARFEALCSEAGFQKAMEHLAEHPSELGAVRADEGELWRVKQDLARGAASAAEGLARYDEKGVGRAAAGYVLARGVYLECSSQAGGELTHSEAQWAGRVVEGMQNEYNRVRRLIRSSPRAVRLEKEARAMIRAADEPTLRLVRTYKEALREQVALGQRARTVLKLNGGIDNAMRQLYKSPEKARRRFERKAFPEGVQGKTMHLEDALEHLVREPAAFGALREKRGRGPSRAVASQLGRSYAEFAATARRLWDAAERSGFARWKSRRLSPSAVARAFAKEASRGGGIRRVFRLERGLDRVGADRVIGHDRYGLER